MLYDIWGVRTMTLYQELYSLMFNAVTDAIAQMEKQNYGNAKEILVRAQVNAEERYLQED